MRCLSVAVGLAGCVALACGDDADADVATEGVAPTGGLETGIGLDGGDAEKLDVAGGGATASSAEAGTGEGCGKVDFLFVIDSSNSMATNQSELIASFPEFVSAIQGTLENVDSYHVGVVTSDAYEFNDSECTEIGALVTQTGGKDSGDETCTPFATTSRFMTEADDLPVAFACAASVGTDGANDEAMMDGATAAVSAALNAPEACNAGFIRDDALLVLVLITDEDDPGTCVGDGDSCEGSAGDPQSWLADLVAVKQFPENIVALSLTRGAPGNVCDEEEGTEKDGIRIMEFVGLLPGTGLVGDICADSFGPFFDQAVGLIDSACGGFIEPVG